MAQKFLPLVRNGEGKTIVNISSEAGSLSTHNDYINRYDYCMSKAALNMQSVILQRYLRPEGIRVVAIHPGLDGGQSWAVKKPLFCRRFRLTESLIWQINAVMTLSVEFYLDYDGCQRGW